MGVPIEVFAIGVNRHDDAGNALGQVQCGAQVFKETLVRDPAQVLEQVAVIAQVRPQHLRDAKGKVAMWDGVQDRFGEQHTEELDLLLVA